MKKIVGFTLAFIIILLSVGCSNSKTDMTNVEKENEQKEITILIKEYDYNDTDTFYNILRSYKERFEMKKGVKVNFDTISTSNIEDYEKKMNAKLYLKEGPTLIFISNFNQFNQYIEQEIAVDIEGKIPNLSKTYNSLLNDGQYFVPIGMLHWPIPLNRRVIDKLEIDDPKLDWTKDDYLSMKEKWLNLNPKHFTRLEYQEFFTTDIDESKVIDELNKEVNLDNPRVTQSIKDIREEIFSSKYIINEDYNYENYYNMIFENESEEYKESTHLQRNYENDQLKYDYFGINGLKSIEVSDFINMNNDIILPDVVSGEDNQLYTWGFIVNKNGKNIELGMEFINGLLDDEIQLEMFTRDYGTYPVNKEIEHKISQIEQEKNVNEKAMALRKYILEQIKAGNYKRSSSSKIKQEIENMLYEDFAKFIFADEPYTDEELSKELQKLENKYNMWLRE